MKVLYTWIGNSDLRASEQPCARDGTPPRPPAGGNLPQGSGMGPVADALLHLEEKLDCAVLLFDYFEQEIDKYKRYCEWLKKRLAEADKPLELIPRPILKGDPTSFNWVYDAMREAIDAFERERRVTARFYLVGPGTSTMAACTLIVARLTACAGTLLQADCKNPRGFRPLELPVDLILGDAPDPASHTADRAPGAQAQKASAMPIVLSPSTRRAFALAQRAAKSQWPVLILGNTGTGKEELARHIHRCSDSSKKFISLNCGAIAENLIESQLFGYRKGAFTGAMSDAPGVFETAGDGIVFLDEVGELPLPAQTRFLRVLQEKKVVRLGEHHEREINCRIVAATHRNLWQAVKEGRFRADLYYRLAGLIITLDDLANRPEDLREMIEVFWQEVVADNPGFPGRELSDAARERLLGHAWPGNVRELKATLVRLAFLAQGPRVSAADVGLALDTPVDTSARGYIQRPTVERPALQGDAGDFDFKANTKRYQQALVRQALDAAGGNKSRAARMLGLSVQHLGRLLKHL
jgi:DNA-binding NtrC family response regulator